MILITRSDGRQFQLDTDFRILGLTGFGGISVELLTEKKAFGDGDILLGQRIPTRQIAIDTICTNTNKNFKQDLRRLVTSFFNPRYEFTLTIDYLNTKREINAKISDVVMPTNNIYKPITMSLIFEALDPYFKSVDKFGKDIAGLNDLLGFPVFIMAERISPTIPQGMAFGAYAFDKSVTIVNDGDVETYFTAEITAKDVVKKFKLIQSEQNFVLFNKDLAKGDKLVIDFANSYVELNGANANNHVDKTSVFYTIPQGESIISFDAEEGSTQVVVKLLYQKRYLGV